MYKSINRQNHFIIISKTTFKGFVLPPCFMFVAD